MLLRFSFDRLLCLPYFKSPPFYNLTILTRVNHALLIRRLKAVFFRLV
nr:MAG TPA: hypothetical protein [Caudoviricetes sp.]